MTAVDAYEALKGALAGHPQLKGYTVDDTVQPPGVVVYPPSLTIDTLCGDITGAEFEVYLVVKATEVKPWATLLGLVDSVVEALEGTPAAIATIEPGTFTGSSVAAELPAYRLVVTYPI